MSIFISDIEIRKIIRESIINEGFFKGSRQTDVGNTSSSEIDSVYEGPLVSEAGGKKYLGNPKTGISPPGFWDKFRSDLQAHLKKNFNDIEIGNLGVTRPLIDSADTNNPDRIAGSKHGAGLAQDVMFHSKSLLPGKNNGKYTNYAEDNKVLATNQNLVDAIRKFMKEKPELGWGGDFGGSSGLPSGRGITEFHHFEIKSENMPKYFAKHEEELSKLGLKSSDMKDTTALKTLYGKLV